MRKILFWLLLALPGPALAQITPGGGVVIGSPISGSCTTNYNLFNNGGVLGCQANGGGGGITIGSTAITSGTTTRVLYDNAGVVGEYTISGSGNVAMTTSPVFTTPTLGVAAGTSLALGSATIGTHDLALAGTALLGSVILRGPSSANLSLGAADAAAPVAQTINVQSVVAGTSNTAGAVTTFNDSGSTGTAVSGGFIFKGTPAGSSGSTQNTRQNMITVAFPASSWNNNQGPTAATLTFGSGVGATPVLMQGPGGSLVVGRSDNSPSVNAGMGLVTTGTLSGFVTNSNGYYVWSNSTSNLTIGQTYLTSPGAAIVQYGAADAASPIAQTIATQGSRAGTDSNIGGAALTIRSGIGTGTGTTSSLILQSPVAVASGTGAQTSTTGLTIRNGQAVLTNYAIASLPTGVQGGVALVTDQLTTCPAKGAAPTNGGSAVCVVYYNGSAWVGI